MHSSSTVAYVALCYTCPPQLLQSHHNAFIFNCCIYVQSTVALILNCETCCYLLHFCTPNCYIHIITHSSSTAALIAHGCINPIESFPTLHSGPAVTHIQNFCIQSELSHPSLLLNSFPSVAFIPAVAYAHPLLSGRPIQQPSVNEVLFLHG